MVGCVSLTVEHSLPYHFRSFEIDRHIWICPVGFLCPLHIVFVSLTFCTNFVHHHIIRSQALYHTVSCVPRKLLID